MHSSCITTLREDLERERPPFFVSRVSRRVSCFSHHRGLWRPKVSAGLCCMIVLCVCNLSHVWKQMVATVTAAGGDPARNWSVTSTSDNKSINHLVQLHTVVLMVVSKIQKCSMQKLAGGRARVCVCVVCVYVCPHLQNWRRDQIPLIQSGYWIISKNQLHLLTVVNQPSLDCLSLFNSWFESFYHKHFLTFLQFDELFVHQSHASSSCSHFKYFFADRVSF